MTLKRPSEYMGWLWCFLPARLADLDASQHRLGCFESLVSGTLVVGGKTIEFGGSGTYGSARSGPLQSTP